VIGSIRRRGGARRVAWLALPALFLLLGTAGVQQVPAADAQPVGTVRVQKRLVDPQNVPVMGDLRGFEFVLTNISTPTPFPTVLVTNELGRAEANVAPGIYTIEERPRFGAELVAISPGQSFQVVGGATVDVIATNRVAGVSRIEIRKQIVDAAGSVLSGQDVSNFEFTITGPAGTATVRTGIEGRTSLSNLGAGTYTVTENSRAGYVLAQLVINGVVVPNGQQFTLGAADVAMVVASNRIGPATGTVRIVKEIVDPNGVVIPGANRQGFEFTVQCGPQFSSTVVSNFDGRAEVLNVPAGTCTIAEAVRPGFQLVSITIITPVMLEITPTPTFTVVAGGVVEIRVRNRMGAPPPPPGEVVVLAPGCNNLSLTWPNGTPTTMVAASITGPLVAIWRFDAIAQRFVGFSPIPNAPNDLVVVNRLDAVFICMNGPGQITRPAIG
jgi:hypothetical protein